MSTLQDNFTCGICHELIIDPVVGRCGHDFCLECLQDLHRWQSWEAQQVARDNSHNRRSGSSSSTYLSCPMCRGVFAEVSRTGPLQLAVCIRLRDIIEGLFPAAVVARRHELQAAQYEWLSSTSNQSATPSTGGGVSDEYAVSAVAVRYSAAAAAAAAARARQHERRRSRKAMRLGNRQMPANPSRAGQPLLTEAVAMYNTQAAATLAAARPQEMERRERRDPAAAAAEAAAEALSRFSLADSVHQQQQQQPALQAAACSSSERRSGRLSVL